MSNIAKLGNNSGNIIVLRPTVNTVIASFPNSIPGGRQAINHALASGAFGGNVSAHGSITITDLTGAVGQSITDVTIGGENQVGANVTVGSTDTTVYAALLAAAINSFTPGVGPNYSAFSIANVVTVNAPPSSGSTVNGSAIGVSQTGVDILNTPLPIDNGSESDSPQDKVFGYRYILNATPGSGALDFAGGEDITRFIVMRGMQSVIDTQTAVIGVGQTSLTVQRTMVSMNILLSAGATETINTISTDEYSIGDQILLSNVTGGSAVTINETGNIVLANSLDFVSGGPEVVLGLKLTDISGTLKWTEVFRAPNIVISVATMRNALIPQGQIGSAEVIMTGGAQAIPAYLAGVDPWYVVVTGNPVLTGLFNIPTPSTTGAIAGDTFTVDYKATPSLGGGAFVTILGIVLRNNEIPEGNLRVQAIYDGVNNAWVKASIQNMAGGNYIVSGSIVDGAVLESKIGSAAVTVSKMGALAVTNPILGLAAVTPDKTATTTKTKQVNYSIAWDAAGLGATKIKIPSQGQFINIQISVTELIEATDDATLTITNDTQAQGVTSTLVVATTAKGELVEDNTFTLSTFDAFDVILLTTSKTTPGGAAEVTLVYEDRE